MERENGKRQGGGMMEMGEREGSGIELEQECCPVVYFISDVK